MCSASPIPSRQVSTSSRSPWLRPAKISSFDDKRRIMVSGTNYLIQPPCDGLAEKGHLNKDILYLRNFGWLTARYRRERWWFFTIWNFSQFLRACVVGGAGDHPMTQVIGLLIIEVALFMILVWTKPYESTRNSAMVAYLLSFSKMTTTGLSIAFLPQLKLARIPATIIGVVIIVVQGLLVLSLLSLTVIGAVSSYMSITRDRMVFRPRKWEGLRQKYFQIIEQKAKNLPHLPVTPLEIPQEPHFCVWAVQRTPKINDPDAAGVTPRFAVSSHVSRSDSLQTNNLPCGSHIHRINGSLLDGRDSGNASREYNEKETSIPPHSSPSRTRADASSVQRPLSSGSNITKPLTPTRQRLDMYSTERFAHAK